jgi:hypothetical protein
MTITFVSRMIHAWRLRWKPQSMLRLRPRCSDQNLDAQIDAWRLGLRSGCSDWCM